MAATPVRPTSTRMEVNGLHLHYLQWGDDAAPPIVCLHGFTGSARDFTGLARRLEDRYRIVATDLRGHGESGWSSGGDYEYGHQLQDLCLIVDRLQLERFTLIGTGMGGVLAMYYATAHPQRLSGLVINDIGPHEESGSRAIMRWTDERPQRFTSIAAAITYLQQASPPFAAHHEDHQKEVAHGVLKEATRGRWVWRVDPASLAQRSQQGALKRPPLWEGLATIECPSLVIWGTESLVLSEAQAKRMAETLPLGELVPVPGMHHAPTLTEAVAVAAIERLLTLRQ